MGVVLAHTDYFLDGERGNVRTRETNLGDLVADAFRWTAEQELGRAVDAGLTNGGGVCVSVETGDVSLATIKAVMPYSNDLSVVQVSGAQLLEALEAACQGIGSGSELGAFPQVSGIQFVLDAWCLATVDTSPLAYVSYLLSTCALVVAASKSVALAKAIMAMFFLETALISQFGKGDEAFRVGMELASGVAFCAVVIALAFWMIVRSGCLLREEEA